MHTYQLCHNSSLLQSSTAGWNSIYSKFHFVSWQLQEEQQQGSDEARVETFKPLTLKIKLISPYSRYNDQLLFAKWKQCRALLTFPFTILTIHCHAPKSEYHKNIIKRDQSSRVLCPSSNWQLRNSHNEFVSSVKPMFRLKPSRFKSSKEQAKEIQRYPNYLYTNGPHV